MRKGNDEGIIKREYGGFSHKSVPPGVCVEIQLLLIVFSPSKMQHRLKMTVIHLRLSCTDRYVKQMLGNKKDNFVPNVGDWAIVTVSIKKTYSMTPLSLSFTATSSYIYMAAKEMVHEYDQGPRP